MTFSLFAIYHDPGRERKGCECFKASDTNSKHAHNVQAIHPNTNDAAPADDDDDDDDGDHDDNVDDGDDELTRNSLRINRQLIPLAIMMMMIMVMKVMMD